MSRFFLRNAVFVLAGFILLGVACSLKKHDNKDIDAQQASETIHSSPSITQVNIGEYTALVPPGPDALPDVPKKLTEKIREGLQKVSFARLDKDKCVPSSVLRTGWKRCLGNYILAATNAKGRIKLIEVYGGTASDSGFKVACERDGACESGVNPPFLISTPTGWTVVALRTVANDKSSEDGVKAVVYVPYSTRLNTPELRQAGLEYLKEAILGAWFELRAKDVKSRYIAGAFVTDFGTPDHLAVLILTEQILSDVGFVNGSDVQRIQMLDRTLVTLGLNRWKSYEHTLSPAGARGIGQGMEPTYISLREKYVRADLPKDHVEGCVDHHTAIKMMACHTDAEWWAIKDRESLLKNPWKRKLVDAGGYNTNIGNVSEALETCGDDWRAESCTKLPSETRRYLIKYEWIYKTLFDPSFRDRLQTARSTLLADATPLERK